MILVPLFSFMRCKMKTEPHTSCVEMTNLIIIKVNLQVARVVW